MNTAVTEAELNQARRNQEFTNAPLGIGKCAFRHPEVSIFPVRYALDESPHSKGSNQGPNPLPKGWTGKLPALHTRSYTLRQLRDGWLYVWNSSDQTFHEYQVSGERFTRHLWTDVQLYQDARHNPSETQPYLLYPRRSQLRIAYSPVQWTWRMCELMRSNPAAQSRWMRALDLPAYCASGKTEHGGDITELGNDVADIYVFGASAPTFTSTLLPTTAGEPGQPYKPAFEEALVRGRVPEQDTALYIALDDPLALIDDLSMNLSGRLQEQQQFDSVHQASLESALAVERLCGFDTEAFFPKTLHDPLQRQAYSDDLYRLLGTFDELERAKDMVPAEEEQLVMMGAAKEVSAAQARFKQTWGHLPAHADWQAALEEWNAKRLWREDVRFDDLRRYLSEVRVEAQQLQAHCQRSEADLLTWLNRLSPSAEAVYHDTCNREQARQLLETAHMLYTLLGNGQQGQQWLCQQAERPSTLFGLALFNFNAELASLIRTLSHNFTTYGTLDDQGRQGDGSSGALTPSSSGDATSMTTRVNELKAVFDLESVRSSRLYQTLSSVTREAMSSLIEVANHQAREAWHGLSGLLLPAMKQHTAFALVATQVLISTEIASTTQLLFNPAYPRAFQAWLLHVQALNNQIAGVKRVLHTPGRVHDQRAARRSLQILEQQRQARFLERPIQIIAKASGSTRLEVSLWQINHWFENLGQNEVTAQLKLLGTREYLTRTKTWMAQNLGSALPTVLVGLNAWNLWSSAQQAQNDGQFTADEWRVMGANAAYAGNALAALWVGPAWSRAGGMVGKLSDETRKVAQASYSAWLAKYKAASAGSAQAATANEFATVSKGLILRTVTWAALGAVAAGLEAWQISEDIGRATSEEEEKLLTWKLRIVKGMGLVSTGQLIGAGLGYWLSFSWVMSTPVTIIIALLGIAYFLVSMAANRFKREGLRLWLYRCSWGRGSIPEWRGDGNHLKQMHALLETLQRPTVVGRAFYKDGERALRRWLGFWVQIQVPTALAGKELTLQPTVVNRWTLEENLTDFEHNRFYDQFLNGHWVDPKLLGELPSVPGNSLSLSDFTYTPQDQHRLWQVWINDPTDNPLLEMEVKYPSGVWQGSSGHSYMFRLALKWAASEADRVKSAVSGELREKDSVVIYSQSSKLTKLVVPNSSGG
ncbi:T6SS effector BTH_I2691 family protein [Pseudomonas sp. NUPR-001]|uniref:T6SS effector BTH_I2691 family protein n=1 Tax=Pseudomonas sp. NUPR-001 TaxID=3416058 RepID=UPI003F98D64B